MALIRRTENQEAPALNRNWDPFQMMQELMRWDPFRELATPGSLGGGYAFSPAFDVRETNDAYVFSADLPGLSEDAIELSVTGNRLTISGQREEEKRDERDRLHMYERRYGAFSRSFALPDGVDADQIEAQLEQGVLKVSVPKKPEVKPRRISLGKLLRSGNKA
jgi:HSP20 family protein